MTSRYFIFLLLLFTLMGCTHQEANLTPIAVTREAKASPTPEATATATPLPTSEVSTFLWVMDTGDQLDEFNLIKMRLDGTELWRTPLGQSEGFGVDPSDGSVWTSDMATDQVIEVDAQGQIVQRLDGFRTTVVTVDPTDGSVWFGLVNEQQVVKLNATGVLWRRALGYRPAAIVVDPQDSHVWVADSLTRRLFKLNAIGQELFQVDTLGFYSSVPQQIALDPRDGSLWHSGFWGVYKLSATGAPLAQVSGFDRPTSLAVDPRDGNVWVCDFSVETPGAIVKLDENGRELLRLSLGRPPLAIAVYPEDGSVWVGIEGELVHLSIDGDILQTLSGFSIPRAMIIATVPPTNPVLPAPASTPTVAP